MTVKELRKVAKGTQEIIISKWVNDIDAEGDLDGYSEVVFYGMNVEIPDDLNKLEVYKILTGLDEVLSLYVKEA